MNAICRAPRPRVLFTLAGAMTLASVALAATQSPWWLVLTAFAGVNELVFAATGACPASLAIGRICRGMGEAR